MYGRPIGSPFWFASKLEVNEYPPKILVILLYAVIQLLDMSLIQETKNFFLELTAAFAGDDLHDGDPLLHSLLHDVVQCTVDVLPLVEDVMQVELELGHSGYSLRHHESLRYGSLQAAQH